MNSSRPKVVAVIMTYNCARLLEKAYEQIPKDLVDEIIVTDDGSKDAIEGEARRLGLTLYRHTPNRGYGGNLKAGLRRALEHGADYIVEIHGDGQFHPAALRDAMPHVEKGTEFIIGSRFIYPRRALELGMPLIRWLANRGLSFIDRLVLRLPFSEFHTGFRIYSKQLLSRVAWEKNSNDYLFSFQIIAQAAYANASVAEVPVEADYRGDHTSHSIRGASIYAFQTFAVLGQYLLARANIRHYDIFPRAIVCRGCGKAALQKMFDLGNVPSVNTYLRADELAKEKPYLLDVHWCRSCTLVQLGTIVPPGELFGHYQHLSSASQSNTKHLEELADYLTKKLSITKNTKVMDVGSNDGTLLSKFRGSTANLFGVDPAENLVPYAKKKGVDQIAAFMSEKTAADIVRTRGHYDVIMALNVVAHTPDVRELLRSILTVLAPGGTFVMEAVHVFATILKGEFDTVYHEHVYCFSLTALVPLFAQAGLTIVDVEEIPTQGGSLRVFAQHSSISPRVSERVQQLLRREEKSGVRREETYVRITKLVEDFKRDFVLLLKEARARHGRIIGLGAPARGIVILNACQVGPDLIDAIVDDTLLKQGRVTPGTHIPVISWEELAKSPAKAYVLLSWNYEQEMLGKLRQQTDAADIIIPFPTLRTVPLAQDTVVVRDSVSHAAARP